MNNDLKFEVKEIVENLISHVGDIPEFSDYDIEVEVEIED
jgi:hypothetical protein